MRIVKERRFWVGFVVTRASKEISIIQFLHSVNYRLRLLFILGEVVLDDGFDLALCEPTYAMQLTMTRDNDCFSKWADPSTKCRHDPSQKVLADNCRSTVQPSTTLLEHCKETFLEELFKLGNIIKCAFVQFCTCACKCTVVRCHPLQQKEYGQICPCQILVKMAR